MTAAPASLAQIVVVGANHRSSSLALRDQLFVDDAAISGFLAGMRERGLSQAVVLSTCDRVEVMTAHADPHRAVAIIASALAERAGIAPEAMQAQLYIHAGTDAVRHCFAVTSSLDSLIIGEPHVLGQVKTVHRLAREANMVGPEIEALLQAAYGVAKRVRSETHIAERPVSIAAAAVQFARDLHGDLDRCDGLLVGTGDMGELVGEALMAAGLRKLSVTAQRASRAEAIAESLGAAAIPYETLGDRLAEADIILTAVGGRHPVLAPEAVTAALRKRRRKPIFIVDAGIPGDVDPAVNRVEGAFLYDLTDLERVALEGRATREAASRSAWQIVDAEISAFVRGRAARTAVPAIVSLRHHFEAAREQVLKEAHGDAEAATRMLINRLLHDPSEVMKEVASIGDAGRAEWDQTERVIRRLFRLEREG